MSAAQELLRRGWDTNHDNIKPEHLQEYWRDDQSPRLTVGQKKTLAGFTTSIDDYDNYDDTDYEAIAKEMKEEEDREAAASKSLHPRYGKIRACPELAEGTEVTEPVSKSLPRNESGGTATSSSRHSRESRNPEDHEAATSKPPLPQGEGWGEGSAGILNNPLPPRRGKSLPPAKAGARMGVMEPVSKTLPMSESGDETISNSSNTEGQKHLRLRPQRPRPVSGLPLRTPEPRRTGTLRLRSASRIRRLPKRRSPERAATSTTFRLRRILRHTQADKGRRRPRRRTRPAQSPRRQTPCSQNPQPISPLSLWERVRVRAKNPSSLSRGRACPCAANNSAHSPTRPPDRIQPHVLYFVKRRIPQCGLSCRCTYSRRKHTWLM